MVVCTERGSQKNQAPIIILPLGEDIIEFGPKRKEMIMVESPHDIHKEEGEEVSIEEDPENLKLGESCLLRFNKFLGMSSKWYEDEVLDLMYKISDRRQKGKGKEMHGTTKFDREIKKTSMDNARKWEVIKRGR